MKVSVVISVYQSHEALRRQVLYWRSLALPEDVEFVLADDGSDPPLDADMPNLRILPTGSRLAWTQGLGRNLCAQAALGDYLLFTDIDHILSREAIMAVRGFAGARMVFPRYLGVLTEEGRFTQDKGVLAEYGMDTKRLTLRGLRITSHTNTFAMPRATFLAFGGYGEGHCTKGYHPGTGKGEDCYFNGRWNRWARRKGLTPTWGPPVYMFPIGRYHLRGETNPGGLFHDLPYTPGERSYKDA